MIIKIWNILNKVLKKIVYIRKYINEIKNINRKKNLYKNVFLSAIEKKQVDDFYKKNYGKKISYKWHRLYKSYTGKFDYKYFPEILFSTKLEFKINPRNICKFLADKNLLNILYKNLDFVKLPTCYITNCSGLFYDEYGNIISKDSAKKNIYNIHDVVVKPTIGSSSGRNVNFYKICNGVDENSGISVENIFCLYQKNFVFQKCIVCSEELKKLYPNSVNTFRIVTYVIDGKIFHCPISLRIGRNGLKVDNAHAGGIFIGVSDDGYLEKYAFTEFGEKFSNHPDTKIKFDGYRIININKIIKAAYLCHEKTPHLTMVSWDFTLDSDDEAVLIEMNINSQSIWFPQLSNGKSMFGDNTEYFLNLIRRK